MRTEAAKAAQIVRKTLKENGISAKVSSKNYTGGSSLYITINQDVLPATLEEIKSYANQFEYGSFDGMTDCYNYDNTRDDIPQVKFVFVEVNYSDEIKAEAKSIAQKYSDVEYEQQDMVWRMLSGADTYCASQIWKGRKERIAA